jgi:hypothetical protein
LDDAIAAAAALVRHGIAERSAAHDPVSQPAWSEKPG